MRGIILIFGNIFGKVEKFRKSEKQGKINFISDCSEKAKICSDYTKINEKVNRFGTRQIDGVYWLAPRSSCLEAPPSPRYFIAQVSESSVFKLTPKQPVVRRLLHLVLLILRR